MCVFWCQFQQWRCLACLSPVHMHCNSCWRRRHWLAWQQLRSAAFCCDVWQQWIFVVLYAWTYCILYTVVFGCCCVLASDCDFHYIRALWFSRPVWFPVQSVFYCMLLYIAQNTLLTDFCLSLSPVCLGIWILTYCVIASKFSYSLLNPWFYKPWGRSLDGVDVCSFCQFSSEHCLQHNSIVRCCTNVSKKRLT